VDQYIGGIEHAILHLLYFRFYHKLLRDAGLVESGEPATNLLCQGMVVAETFFRDEEGGGKTWFNPADVSIQRDERARIVGALAGDGLPVQIGGIEKMSKSKNNGVDPQTMVGSYGADTVRLFSMFASPPDMSLEWNEAGVEGMARFLRRVWAQVHRHVSAAPVAESQAAAAALARGEIALDAEQKAVRRKLHETIAKVSDDIGRRHAFNTAIAAVMELLNVLTKFDDESAAARAVRQEAWQAVTLLLNPITPHFSHALWQALGNAESLIEDQSWPAADSKALEKDALVLAVQVNGRLRGQIEVAVNAAKDECERLALADPVVARFLEGQTVKKVIVVPGKIVNIVAG
jgi:leucyl-tRNA synthetase